MVPPLTVRSPFPDDHDAIAALLGELGYPASPAAVGGRLIRIAADPAASVWVASRGTGVGGVATAHLHASLNQDAPAAQLTLLVVAASCRGTGCGRALVTAAEEWARERGARRLTVASALHRAEAHAFYERLGYVLSGRRYACQLGQG